MDLAIEYNPWSKTDFAVPSSDKEVIFECRYELESIAAFLQLLYDCLLQMPNDAFFRQYKWRDAVGVIKNTTSELMRGSGGTVGLGKGSLGRCTCPRWMVLGVTT